MYTHLESPQLTKVFCVYVLIFHSMCYYTLLSIWTIYVDGGV